MSYPQAGNNSSQGFEFLEFKKFDKRLRGHNFGECHPTQRVQEGDCRVLNPGTGFRPCRLVNGRRTRNQVLREVAALTLYTKSFWLTKGGPYTGGDHGFDSRVGYWL